MNGGAVVVVEAEVAVAVAVASRHLQVLGGGCVAELPLQVAEVAVVVVVPMEVVVVVEVVVGAVATRHLHAEVQQEPQDRRDVHERVLEVGRHLLAGGVLAALQQQLVVEACGSGRAAG